MVNQGLRVFPALNLKSTAGEFARRIRPVTERGP